ncbi:hypothetical protein H4S06_002812 [Coemansia sp. BCRC 34490]|nr:hypothetical protein H4S06_002812 [Coemansia sp. BCRC 34490]
MNKIYGNPFETNVLVKCERRGVVVKSFFVHELSPNCEVSELRSRVEAVGVPLGEAWELVKVLPSGEFVVLKDSKALGDYRIECWDSVHVRPAAECAAKSPSFGQKISRLGLKVLGIKRVESRTSMSAPVSPAHCATFTTAMAAAGGAPNEVRRISPSALNLQQYKEKRLSSTSLLTLGGESE